MGFAGLAKQISLSLDKSSSSLSTVLEKHEGNDDFISVEADRERIKKVLYNILHNAIKFTKSIIEAHGGKIWAENNPDGKGATFSFSLPLDK